MGRTKCSVSGTSYCFNSVLNCLGSPLPPTLLFPSPPHLLALAKLFLRASQMAAEYFKLFAEALPGIQRICMREREWKLLLARNNHVSEEGIMRKRQTKFRLRSAGMLFWRVNFSTDRETKQQISLSQLGNVNWICV